MKKLKKGFTIVELVIVIAVIAILAAVLIPTFSNIIDKAYKSNDTQIVRNLNSALTTDLQLRQGSRYETVHDAFVVCQSYGYTIERIVAKSSLNIAYDYYNARFVLLDESTDLVVFPTSIDDSKEWYVSESDRVNYYVVKDGNGAKEFINSSGYSVYAGFEFSATTVTLNGVGFDMGEIITIEKVIYNNTESNKDVMIRTCVNNVTLEVNDTSTNGIIRHYGVAGYVNIISCAPCSYYENGIVEIQKIATGRIVLEENSNVEQIHFAISEGIFDNIIVAYDQSVVLPKFSRDTVEIPASGALVVELQKESSNSEFIWLYKQGTLSQVAIVNTKISAIQPNSQNTKLEGVAVAGSNVDISLGVVTQRAEMKKAASEIANNYSGAHVDIAYTGLIEDNDKKAPLVDNIGNIEGDEDLGSVIKEGSTDLAETIKIATCQHPNLPTEYEHDENVHYIICPDCGKHANELSHNSDGKDGKCSVCGYNTGKVITQISLSSTTGGTSGVQASLASAIAQINTDLSSSVASNKHYEYQIQLPAGEYGSTPNESGDGYIADVYVIKQYPNWNGLKDSDSNIGAGEYQDKTNATITIIGSDDPENPTIFRGIFVIVGHGNSKSGWETTADVASTTFKNIVFDHTGLIGTKNEDDVIIGSKRFLADGSGCMPITCGSGSQNVTIDNCKFINTGRMNFGYSQGTDVTVKCGTKTLSLGGYSFNPSIKNCVFENVTCGVQGYFHGTLDVFSITGCSGTVGSFVNDQTGSGNLFAISNCEITFTKCDGYLFRSNNIANVAFTNCTFNRLEEHSSSTSDGMLVLRQDKGSTVKFTNCTFTGETDCKQKNGVNENTTITFDKCTGVTSYSDVGTSIPENYFTFK